MQNAPQAAGLSQQLRNNTEVFFHWLSQKVVRHPWWAIVLMLGITAAVLPAFRHLTVDFSTEAFLPRHDTTIKDYDDSRFQFAQTGFGLVTIETPADVFTLENLRRNKTLMEDIEAN